MEGSEGSASPVVFSHAASRLQTSAVDIAHRQPWNNRRMSNHPHQRPRRNDDDDAPAAGPPMGPPPAPVNGYGAALRPNAAKAIGEAAGTAMAGTLGEVLPPLLSDAFAAVLSQVPVRTIPQPLYCGPCFVRRVTWERAHEADLKTAIEQMQIAAQAMPPGDPRVAQLNPLMFLPPHLLPSPDPGSPNPDAIPDPALAITMIGGTLYCGADAPGTGGDAAKPPLIIAHGSIPDGTLAQVFSQLRGRAA
jgi:hypothetical protein